MQRSPADILRLIVPPIIPRIAFALKNGFSSPILEYAPDGWETKLESDAEQGWNTDGVVRIAATRWKNYCSNLRGSNPLGFSHEHDDHSVIRDADFHNVHMSFAYMVALAAIGKQHVRVLDYGGGLGQYYKLARALYPDLIFDYHVKEVERMAAKGAELNNDICWHINDSCLDSAYDLVMMTGSIPYIRDWKLLIPKLLEASDPYFSLFRIPVVEDAPTFVVIQRIYGSKMLHQVLNQSELLGVVHENGFERVREMIIGDSPYIKGAPAKCEIKAWLFKRSTHPRTDDF